MEEAEAKQLALSLAVLCVRRTCIEEIHGGKVATSVAGDFSDVQVVTPARDIPWPEVSRISDEEMRTFMIAVVDRLYTSLLRMDDPSFVERIIRYGRRATRTWNKPRYLEDWWTGEMDVPRG